MGRINGKWIHVTVERGGKQTAGWLHVKHVALEAASADRAAAQPYICGADFEKNGHLESPLRSTPKRFGWTPRTRWPMHTARTCGAVWATTTKPSPTVKRRFGWTPNMFPLTVSAGQPDTVQGNLDQAIADCTQAIRYSATYAFAFATPGSPGSARASTTRPLPISRKPSAWSRNQPMPSQVAGMRGA